MIDLSASQVGIFNWGLPVDCRWRWNGFETEFRYWRTNYGGGDLAAWQQTVLASEPSALFHMARYFADKGELVRSRKELLDAKRLNYAGMCHPRISFFECVGVVIEEELSRLSKQFGFDDGDSMFVALASPASMRGEGGRRESKTDLRQWTGDFGRFWPPSD